MTLLLIHLMATCFMTGVIWVIQVVHYPLFSSVGIAEFTAYQRLHMRKITWVVMPAMLLELGTGILLLAPHFFGLVNFERLMGNELLLWINVIGLGVIWASTALSQVPNHATLMQGFEQGAYRRLVRWNWIRTIVWSIRLCVVFYLVMSV